MEEFYFKCKIAEEKWYECSVEADSIEDAVDKVCNKDFSGGEKWSKDTNAFICQWYTLDQYTDELVELEEGLATRFDENVEL